MEFTSEVSTNEVIIKAIVLNKGYGEPKLEDVSTLRSEYGIPYYTR